MTIEVRDVPEAHRFEAHLDGELAGSILYTVKPDAIVLVHTEVLPAFEGKGVGSVLVRRTLEELRARGTKIIPVCPFVTAYLRKHPEYLDVVAPDHRADFEAA